MAARSEALAAKGWIDPTKLGKFRVVLSDSLRGKPSSEIYTAVQYNHKPALSTGKPPASAQLEASTTNDASYDLSFDDGGGDDQYAYKGTRSTEKGKYALVFDRKTRTFVLHEVDSTFKMNLVETPGNKDADSLKERFPHLKRTKGGGIEKRKRMEIKKRKVPDKMADKAQEKMAPGGTKSSEASSAPKEAPRPKDAASSKANPLIAKKSEKSKAAAQKAASQKLQAPQPMIHPLPPKPPPTAHGFSGKSSRPSSKSNNSTGATTTTSAATAAAASSSMLPPPLPRSRPGQTQMAPPPRPKGSSMSPPPGSGARREEIPLPPKPQFTNLPNKKPSAKASMSPPPAPDRSAASAKASGSARDRSPDAATSKTAKSSSKTAKAPKAPKASKNTKASLPLPARPASPQEAEPAAGIKKKNKKPAQYESDEDEDDDDGGLVVEFPGGPSSKSFGNKNDFSPAFPPPVPIRPFSEFEQEEPDEDAVYEDLEQEFEAVFNEVDQDDEEKNLSNFKLPSPVNNGGAASDGGPELAVDDDELEREFMMVSDESEISEEE